MGAARDVPACPCVHAGAEGREGTLETAIPRGGIVFRHPDYQAFGVRGHAWLTRLTATHTPVKLPRSQSAIPPQEGVRCEDCGDLFKALASEHMPERSAAAAVRVRAAEPASAKLRFQDTVLLVEVRDHRLLCTVDPASEHDEEQGQVMTSP